MTEIKEQFVPYELSLELKELGFNEHCVGYYLDKLLYPAIQQISTIRETTSSKDFCKEYPDSEDSVFIEWDANKYDVAAPLWQQAFDWFREKHNLDSYIRKFGKLEGMTRDFSWRILKLDTEDKIKGYSNFSKTHQEAQVACLEELIKIVKNKP